MVMRKCVLLLGNKIRKSCCFKDLKVKADPGEASKNVEIRHREKTNLKVFKSCFLNRQNN